MTHHGTMDKSLSEQKICVSVSIFCIVKKTGPILLSLVGLTLGMQAGGWAGGQAGRRAGRQEGRQADKI